MRSRPCKRSHGFTWSRRVDAGAIVYRLFWRRPGGRVHSVWNAYVVGAPRTMIARDLCRLRRNIREFARAL